ARHRNPPARATAPYDRRPWGRLNVSSWYDTHGNAVPGPKATCAISGQVVTCSNGDVWRLDANRSVLGLSGEPNMSALRQHPKGARSVWFGLPPFVATQ